MLNLTLVFSAPSAISSAPSAIKGFKDFDRKGRRGKRRERGETLHRTSRARCLSWFIEFFTGSSLTVVP